MTLAKRKVCHKSDSRRASHSNAPLYKAAAEYGWEAFAWEVLEECATIPDLHASEIRWIAACKTLVAQGGYNRALGGPGASGVEKTPQTRALLSARNKGKIPSRQCIDAATAARKTPEFAKKISRSRVGLKINWTPEGRARVNAALRLRSAESCGGKIPRDALEDILERRARKETFRSIGEVYGVAGTTIFKFILRRRK